jgi:hypothetical protein
MKVALHWGRNGVGSRFRPTVNHVENALPENDSRPLPRDSTKKYLAGCLEAVTKLAWETYGRRFRRSSETLAERGGREHLSWDILFPSKPRFVGDQLLDFFRVQGAMVQSYFVQVAVEMGGVVLGVGA